MLLRIKWEAWNHSKYLQGFGYIYDIEEPLHKDDIK